MSFFMLVFILTCVDFILLYINFVLLRVRHFMVVKAYSIQVSGIRCTNCAAKIEKSIKETLNGEVIKVWVNIHKEKVFLTCQNEALLQIALQTLKKLGYQIIGQPVMVSGGEDYQRNISFEVIQNELTSELLNTLTKTLGVMKATQAKEEGKIIIKIIYNCQIVKGRQLSDLIGNADSNFRVINAYVESFKNQKQSKVKSPNIILASILISLFLIGDMILPQISSWFQMLLMYPQQFGVFSFAVILNAIATIYVLFKYGKSFIVNAYRNYVEFRATNMETLIALGTLSAFSLFLFFVGRYTIEQNNGGLKNRGEAIMNIIDALTSGSIIVLVVTVGKHFEAKIKKKIDSITASIFPQSTLFQNMQVTWIQLKNRNLMIKSEKKYDISLIERSDILKLQPGRLLVDVIIISGEIKATQSVFNGSEDVSVYKKGQRIQSGSIIHENIEALVQVENVFQKSILVQIGTQIKLGQNQEQSNQSGIQVACKKIASYFVRGVILLSIAVMLVWSILIYFNFVDVPICGVCWIVERGIGVLVASCPCALGLAVPSVIAIILNLATKSGILIKNNSIFEKMKNNKIISFDKTGTLFNRIQKIENHQILSQFIEENKMWEIIAIIQKQIRHPLAQVLYKEAYNRSQIKGMNFNFLLIEKPTVQKQGIRAIVRNKMDNSNHQIRIGNINLMKNNKISVPFYKKQEQASTQLFLSIGNQLCLVIFLNTHSNLRPQAFSVIKKIKEQGKQVHILSGDSRQSVQRLGFHLGIPPSCQHPEQSAFMKMDWIKQQQADGKTGILMVGDGLNDIPCLQEAAIGVSINAKSELNINAADVVILSENLYKILALIRLIKRANTFILINLVWAFAYNITIMPFVAGVFFKFDIYISPVWSSIAMSLSSILVVLFAQLLVCFKYDQSLDHKTKQQQYSDQQSIKVIKKHELIELSTNHTKNTSNYQHFQQEMV